MARAKPKTPAVVIASLDDADEVLREMAECYRQIVGITVHMNEAIDAAKEAAKLQAAAPTARLKALEESLATYATYQKDELFKARKSITRVFGTFGFRKSTKITPAKKQTWGSILEALKKLGLAQAVRTKEEVNKEVLQEWPDERLEAVGACRDRRDEFWCEVDFAALEGAHDQPR